MKKKKNWKAFEVVWQQNDQQRHAKDIVCGVVIRKEKENWKGMEQ